MGRLRPILALLLWSLAAQEGMGAGVGPARSEGAGTSTPVVAEQPDGSLFVQARSYRATVGADGNLHSIVVGESEMVDARVAVSLGTFFYSEGPRRLDTVRVLAPGAVEATDGTYTILYRFYRDEIRARLTNEGADSVPYYVVLSPQITTVSNSHTDEAAAVPSTERNWGDVRFTAESGAHLELVGGTRIWGWWLGRQVWEVSAVAPDERKEIRLLAGLGEPPHPTLEQLVGVQVRIPATDGVVAQGHPLEMSVSVENRSDRTLQGLLSMELLASRGGLAIYAAVEGPLPPKQVTDRSFRARVEAPDFYTARVVLRAEGREIGRASAAAGYRVAEIAPNVGRGPDFQQFWDRLLSEVGDEPPQFRMEMDSANSRRGVSTWVVEYESIGGRAIHGWYLHPDGAEQGPAILYLSVYGARPIPPPSALARRGYAVLAIDVRGNRVNLPRPRAFEDYSTLGIESPETYSYREIVGHCLRAIRFLASRPEVDPERIAVVGVSEGGGLGLVLAALSPEVRAVAADAPMLCDMPLSVQSAGWPYTEILRRVEENPSQAPQIYRTLSYFDAANLAPDIECPVLISLGLLDSVSLPAAVYGVFNRIGGPKEMRAFPEAGHEGGGAQAWAYKLRWLASALAREPAS